jgi:dynactin 5
MTDSTSATSDAATVAVADDYIKTTTHNFISRQATIEGARQVGIQGRSIVHSGVIFRGDLGVIRIGRYVWIDSDTMLAPAPPLRSSPDTKRLPLLIGNHTQIGKDCFIEASAIGSMVRIGNNAMLGERCVIKDCCIIDPYVILGKDTVIPPFTRVYYDGSSPILHYAELPPSLTVDLQEQAMDHYDVFANQQRPTR